MDQFTVVKRKNWRISRSLWGVLIFLAIVILAFFCYLVPIWSRLSRMYTIKQRVLSTNNLSAEQAKNYLEEVESDPGMMSWLLGDEGFNSMLMQLYLENGDYDAVLTRARLALAKKDTRAYDSYLRYAYEKKLPAYRQRYDAGLAAFRARQFDDALREFQEFQKVQVEEPVAPGLTDDLQQKVRDLQADARLQMEAIAFVQPFDRAVEWGNLGEVETASLAARVTTSPQLEDFTLHNSIYNLWLERYYLKQGDYQLIIDRSIQAGKIADLPLYHYYGALAYDKTGKTALAVEEMKRFLSLVASDADQSAGEQDAADIYLATHFAAAGDFASAIKYQAAVVKARAVNSDLMQEAWKVIVQRQEYNPQKDSDLDGLSDQLEKLLGTDPLLEDTDGDRDKDDSEFLSGHDPLRAEPDDLLSDRDYYNIYAKLIAA